MEDFLKLTGNYFFPLCLSIFLIIRIDKFLSLITLDMKDIKDTQTKILLHLQINSQPKK